MNPSRRERKAWPSWEGPKWVGWVAVALAPSCPSRFRNCGTAIRVKPSPGLLCGWSSEVGESGRCGANDPDKARRLIATLQQPTLQQPTLGHRRPNSATASDARRSARDRETAAAASTAGDRGRAACRPGLGRPSPRIPTGPGRVGRHWRRVRAERRPSCIGSRRPRAGSA
jgi:hypothetical protein